MTTDDNEQIGLTAVQEGAQNHLIKGQIDAALLPRMLKNAFERAQIRTQVRHLNRVLRAIRSINQLIVREKARERCSGALASCWSKRAVSTAPGSP